MPSASHFGAVDAAIVGVYLVLTFAAAMAVRRHAGRLETFILAGRGVNAHLGAASLAATELGLVTCMYTGQLGYQAGFAGIFIGVATAFWVLLSGWTGFLVKRLRATGAATVPEVVERVYGPRVRWWAGLVVAVGGILNMGLFLRVGGDFVVTFTGLGHGGFEIAGLRLGYLEVIMTVLLSLALVYTAFGGMLSVLVADLLQFVVLGVGMVLATLLAIRHVGWGNLVEKVRTVHGAGGFDPLANPEMGGGFVLYIFLFAFAGLCSWQTSVSRVLSSTDEQAAARMYRWVGFYYVGRFALPIVWGVAALALVSTAQFPPGDPQKSLLAMPTALAAIVPAGLAGVILAAMLAAEMSTDSSYLLSWATVIVHDLVKPFARLTPAAELRLTRVVVVAIGAFLLVFGLWYQIEGNVYAYLAVTGTMYMASLTALLVAGLYWPRAHRLGAYLALALGAVCPLVTLVWNQLVQRGVVAGAAKIPAHWGGLAALVLAAAGMWIGSLAATGPARRRRAATDSAQAAAGEALA